MRILLSNDDGYFAPGIQALFQALEGMGEIVVVAPEQNRSGASNSLTLDQPLEILLRDGHPTGDVRAPGGPWRLARETHWISIPWMRASLDPARGPQVESALVVDFQGGSARQ